MIVKPATCQVLGRTDPNMHRAITAVIEVRRDTVKPTGPGYRGSLISSGIMAAVNTRMLHNSKGVRNRHCSGVPFPSRQPARRLTLLKARVAIARFVC